MKFTIPGLLIFGFLMLMVGAGVTICIIRGGWLGIIMLPLFMVFPLFFLQLVMENQPKKEKMIKGDG